MRQEVSKVKSLGLWQPSATQVLGRMQFPFFWNNMLFKPSATSQKHLTRVSGLGNFNLQGFESMFFKRKVFASVLRLHCLVSLNLLVDSRGSCLGQALPKLLRKGVGRNARRYDSPKWRGFQMGLLIKSFYFQTFLILQHWELEVKMRFENETLLIKLHSSELVMIGRMYSVDL